MLNWGNKFANFGKAAGTICLCTLLVIALTLTGCVGADPGNPSQGETPAPAAEKKEMKALVNNPLEAVSTSGEVTQGDTRLAFDYSTFTGLYDEAVQEKINARILEVVEQQKSPELPPYRGIKTAVTDEYVLADIQVNLIQQGSFNNILSMTIYTSMTYAHKDDLWQKEEQGYYDRSVYVSETIPLVFDLNTGEDVQLADLFHDDMDYMFELNQWMDHHLAQAAATEEGWSPSSMEMDLKLVGPFKGLSEDQKFYLTSYGLALLFGPEDTQFTSPYGFYTATVSIPFQDLEGKLALAYRFMDEETDLYTSRERPVYSLLNMTKDATAGVSEYHSEGNVSFSLALQYQEDLPENVKEKVLELGVFDETVKAELKESLTPDSYGYYDIGVYVNCVGDYINLGYSETAYGWDNESGDQCYSHYLHEYYCYHRETGELVELEDLFHEQWNPEQVITDGMYKHQRKLSDLYDDIPKEDHLIRDEVHRQYAHLTSFAVDTTCLNLAGSYVDEETGETRNEWISVPYEDIGCYLMTIFD